MNVLIELLKQIDFSTLDIDELLDNRDAEVFDAEWIRVYNVVESLKNAENYSEVEKKNNSEVREQVFRIIYELTSDGDLAGYVSDDFGLIVDIGVVIVVPMGVSRDFDISISLAKNS